MTQLKFPQRSPEEMIKTINFLAEKTQRYEHSLGMPIRKISRIIEESFDAVIGDK